MQKPRYRDNESPGYSEEKNSESREFRENPGDIIPKLRKTLIFRDLNPNLGDLIPESKKPEIRKSR